MREEAFNTGVVEAVPLGTKVLTDQGEKSIEDIQIGDKVLSKDDVTGEMAYKEVEWLFQREVEETYNLTVGGQVITTTDEHPFWIVGKGWVESKNLRAGDVLTTLTGSELPISNIEVRSESRTVYNFKVKEYHTYFVSNLGIWTHNSCQPDFINDDRVPIDKETVLKSGSFSKTKISPFLGAQVYKRGGNFYPLTGEVKEGTRDPNKRLHIK